MVNLKLKAKEIRKKILKIIHKSKSSHIGGMLSCIDLLVFLYYKGMNFNKQNYNDASRDYFILSKGHVSLAIYAILEDLKIISLEDLESYCQNGGKLMGHLDNKVPGVEVATGSLGHGLPIAAGIALGNKLNNINSKTYCLIGDGECNEGSIWEALIFIANKNLNNLVVIIDANKLQGYNYCSEICKEAILVNMLKGLNLNFYRINGHDFDEIEKTFDNIKSTTNENSHIVFMDTIKGKGVSFMEDKLEWHYKSPNDEQYKLAVGELD